MLKLLGLSTLQCLLLTSAQVFLKIAMARMGAFEWSWSFFGRNLTNWPLAASGITIVGASLLWFYILKVFPFSQAYPMISISYVFGMLAAIFIFHETIPLTRWLGVMLIIGGVILIARQ